MPILKKIIYTFDVRLSTHVLAAPLSTAPRHDATSPGAARRHMFTRADRRCKYLLYSKQPRCWPLHSKKSSPLWVNSRCHLLKDFPIYVLYLKNDIFFITVKHPHHDGSTQKVKGHKGKPRLRTVICHMTLQ